MQVTSIIVKTASDLLPPSAVAPPQLVLTFCACVELQRRSRSTAALLAHLAPLSLACSLGGLVSSLAPEAAVHPAVTATLEVSMRPN